jgi:hypothetical protein
MAPRAAYDEHLDVLIGLISYLALTPKKSRTPPNLAADLSLDQQEVRAAFENFPGLFRRSKRTSSEGEHFYTLQARFALREADDDDPALPSLRADILQALLEFVAQRAQAEQTARQFQAQAEQTAQQFHAQAEQTSQHFYAQAEQASRHFEASLRQARLTNVITLAVAVLAGLSAVYAALVGG